MKKKHYIVSMMAVIFLYLLGIGNFHGALQANNQKTQHASTKIIKIGFPIQEGLSMKDEKGNYTGYMYDYLKELSQYRFQRAQEDLETAAILLGVIAYFNRTYVKGGIFNKSLSKILDTSFRLREKVDYQDFFIVSELMAAEQLKKASIVLNEFAPYLADRWEKM